MADLEELKAKLKEGINTENNELIKEVIDAVKHDKGLLMELFNSKLHSGVPTTPLIYAVKRGNFEAVR